MCLDRVVAVVDEHRDLTYDISFTQFLALVHFMVKTVDFRFSIIFKIINKFPLY